MKTLSYLFLFFSAFNTFANSHFEMLKNKLDSVQSINQLEDVFKGKYKSFLIEESILYCDRNLDFGYTQKIYQLEIEYDERYINTFDIHIITTITDSIILGKINLLGYDRDEIKKSYLFKEDKRNITNYVNKHNSLYHSKLSYNQVKHQLMSFLVYGFGCSMGGGFYPKEALHQMELIKNKNYKELSKLIKQVNPEFQAYGIDGLTQLENKGVKIKKRDKKIISHLLVRNTSANHCSGCTYGIDINVEQVIYLANTWIDRDPTIWQIHNQNRVKKGQ